MESVIWPPHPVGYGTSGLTPPVPFLSPPAQAPTLALDSGGNPSSPRYRWTRRSRRIVQPSRGILSLQRVCMQSILTAGPFGVNGRLVCFNPVVV